MEDRLIDEEPACYVCHRHTHQLCRDEGRVQLEESKRARWRYFDGLKHDGELQRIQDTIHDTAARYIAASFNEKVRQRAREAAEKRAELAQRPLYNVWSYHGGWPPPLLCPPEVSARYRELADGIEARYRRRVDRDWVDVNRHYPVLLDQGWSRVRWSLSPPPGQGTTASEMGWAWQPVLERVTPYGTRQGRSREEGGGSGRRRRRRSMAY